MNLLSEEYDAYKSTLDSRWIELRQAGADFVREKGLPTKYQEDWHYTSVKTLASAHLKVATSATLNNGQEKMIQNELSPEMINLVFVNCEFNQMLSSQLPKEISWSDMIEKREGFEDSFDALNAAYMRQIIGIKVLKESLIKKPVRFLFVNLGESNLMNHPRLKIEVGARSAVSIVESYMTLSAGASLTNAVVDVHIGDSAKVTYIRTQEESLGATSIGRTHLNVGAHATLESLCLSTGAALSRHSLKVNLIGPGSNSEILGVYAARRNQHVDNTSWIQHLVGECNSNQLYKGILDDESRTVFAGTVYIAKDAQKANSSQLNNNLLLSDKAEADSKPCLNIFADDVKAAHGSTVGQLNKEELFYLQSRAISKEKAIPMLAFGFLSEVVYKISDKTLQLWLTQKLETAFVNIKLAEVSV